MDRSPLWMGLGVGVLGVGVALTPMFLPTKDNPYRHYVGYKAFAALVGSALCAGATYLLHEAEREQEEQEESALVHQQQAEPLHTQPVSPLQSMQEMMTMNLMAQLMRQMGAPSVGAQPLPGQQVSGSLPPPPPQQQQQPEAIKRFDFNRFREEPDEFPHIRIIGKSGSGKTFLADWLLDILGGDRSVITVKRRPENWRGLDVYGIKPKFFNYEACWSRVQWLHAEMCRRYDLIESGHLPGFINVAADEWRLIQKHCPDQIDPKTRQIVRPGAATLMKDLLTVSREAQIRIIALAQSERVDSWGLNGEGDIAECFTTIRLGRFATEYAKKQRRKCRKGTEDYEYWTLVLADLEWQQSRRGENGKPLSCCLVEDEPGLVPDLSDWSRVVVPPTERQYLDNPQPPPAQQLPPASRPTFDPLLSILDWCKTQDEPIEPWQIVAAEVSGLEQFNEQGIRFAFEKLAEDGLGRVELDGERVLFFLQKSTVSTPDTPHDTDDTTVSKDETTTQQGVEPTHDTTDTYPYTAQQFQKDFPEYTEENLFHRISDTTLPPGRFIKEELKITNGSRYKLAKKAVGYLVRKYGDFRLMEKFKDYL
ncbi:MAG: hypothetical protein F6J86_20705 [Symploca sp. SIO1B1]|nr:hypothetical protein [Symploca sp. SIO1B1]